MRHCPQLHETWTAGLQKRSMRFTSLSYCHSHFTRRFCGAWVFVKDNVECVSCCHIGGALRVRKQLWSGALPNTFFRFIFSASDISSLSDIVNEDVLASHSDRVSVPSVPASVAYKAIPLSATGINTWRIDKVGLHNGLPKIADITVVDTRKLKRGNRVLPRPRIKRIRMEYEKHWEAIPHQEHRFLVILVKTDLGRSAVAKKLLDSLSELLVGTDRISVAVLVSRRSHSIAHLLANHRPEALPPNAMTEEVRTVVTSSEVEELQSNDLNVGNFKGSEEKNMDHMVKEVIEKMSGSAEDTVENSAREKRIPSEGLAGDVFGTQDEGTAPLEGSMPCEQANISADGVLAAEDEKEKFPEVLSDPKRGSIYNVMNPSQLHSNHLGEGVSSAERVQDSSGVKVEEKHATLSSTIEDTEEFDEESTAELQETFLGAASEENEQLNEEMQACGEPFESALSDQPRKTLDYVSDAQEDFDEEKKMKNYDVLSLKSEVSDMPGIQDPITPLPPRFIEEEVRYHGLLRCSPSSSSSHPLDVTEEEMMHPDVVERTMTASVVGSEMELEAELKEAEKAFPEIVEEALETPEEKEAQSAARSVPGCQPVASHNTQDNTECSTVLCSDEEKPYEAEMSSLKPPMLSDLRKIYTRGKENFAYFSSAAVGCRLMVSSAAQSQQSAHLIDTSPFLPFFSYSFASNSIDRRMVREKNGVSRSSADQELLETKKLSETKNSSHFSRIEKPNEKIGKKMSFPAGEKFSIASVSTVSSPEGDATKAKKEAAKEQKHSSGVGLRASIVVETLDQYKNKIKRAFPLVVHKNEGTQGTKVAKEVDKISSSTPFVSLLSMVEKDCLEGSALQIPKSVKKTMGANENVESDLTVKKSQAKSKEGNLMMTSLTLSGSMIITSPPSPSSIPSLKAPFSDSVSTKKDTVFQCEPKSTKRKRSGVPSVAVSVTPSSQSSENSSPPKAEHASSQKEDAGSDLKLRTIDSREHLDRPTRSTPDLKGTKVSNLRLNKLSKALPKGAPAKQKINSKKKKMESDDFDADNSLSAQLSRRLKEELRQRALQRKMQKLLEKEKRHQGALKVSTQASYGVTKREQFINKGKGSEEND